MHMCDDIQCVRTNVSCWLLGITSFGTSSFWVGTKIQTALWFDWRYTLQLTRLGTHIQCRCCDTIRLASTLSAFIFIGFWTHTKWYEKFRDQCKHGSNRGDYNAITTLRISLILYYTKLKKAYLHHKHTVFLDDSFHSKSLPSLVECCCTQHLHRIMMLLYTALCNNQLCCHNHLLHCIKERRMQHGIDSWSVASRQESFRRDICALYTGSESMETDRRCGNCGQI